VTDESTVVLVARYERLVICKVTAFNYAARKPEYNLILRIMKINGLKFAAVHASSVKTLLLSFFLRGLLPETPYVFHSHCKKRNNPCSTA
jgi:hypothetical protein